MNFLFSFQFVNLSFQDLGDSYQRKHLDQFLGRLVQCTHLQLMDNSLSQLSGITLASCVQLNLARNSFSSFKKLPQAPLLESMNLASNEISSLSGLSVLLRKYPHLQSLILRGNECEHEITYREKWVVHWFVVARAVNTKNPPPPQKKINNNNK